MADTELATALQCVLIVPATPEEVDADPNSKQVYAKVSTITGPKDELMMRSWRDSPISAALGFPLKATAFPSESRNLRNRLASPLFLVVDPEDELFGKITFKHMLGGVLLARQDEGRLHEKQVEVLLQYINTLAGEVTAHVKIEWESEEERIEKAKELKSRRMTKGAFGEFFQIYKRSKVEANEPGWKKIKFPAENV